jgi:hypothetical protein
MNKIKEYIMNMNFLKIAVISIVLTTSFHSNATIIASTDFDGRTVSGSTASNINWVVNGISPPGDISADFPLFDTPDAQNRFAVNRNIGNSGPWETNIALNFLATNDINLTFVTFDAFIFNNSGALQGNEKFLDINASIFDMSTTLISSIDQNVYTSANSSFSQGQSVSFDFSGTSLLAGNNYFLRLTATGGNQGNNAGFDNLVVNGELNKVVVPEPSALAILSLGLIGLVSRRFKK